MTNFDAVAGNEPIISDVEAKEIALQLSGQSLRSKNVRKQHLQQQQQQHEAQEMDAGTISYLQATYSHLHENQVRKLNDILAMNEEEEERASAKRVKRRLKKMEVVDDEQNTTSYDHCEVNELAREMQSMQFGADNRLRPIITFTPVHAGDEGEHHDEMEDCRRVSSPSASFSDHVSSGSSSPLLEVPMCEFPNMTAEMMRPPFN